MDQTEPNSGVRQRMTVWVMQRRYHLNFHTIHTPSAGYNGALSHHTSVSLGIAALPRSLLRLQTGVNRIRGSQGCGAFTRATPLSYMHRPTIAHTDRKACLLTDVWVDAREAFVALPFPRSCWRPVVAFSLTRQ